MNRLLTEGRRAFLRRVTGIERGVECARYEPLLSALADGEASAEDLAGKVAAVAASAAALAGGGTAVDQFANHQGLPQPAAAEQVEAKPVKDEQAPVGPAHPEPIADEQPAAAEPAPVPEPPPPPPPPPDPANEFAPGGNTPAAPASPTPAAAPAQPGGGGFMSAGRGEAGGGGGGGEFAP